MTGDRLWNTHVYDPDGQWCGFFRNEEEAAKWVGKREGYEVTSRKPQRRNDVEETGVHPEGPDEGPGDLAEPPERDTTE